MDGLFSPSKRKRLGALDVIIELLFTGSDLFQAQQASYTNGQILEEELYKIGCALSRSTTVLDQKESLQKAIGEAIERSDVLFLLREEPQKGRRDLMKEAVAALLERPLLLDPRAFAAFEKRSSSLSKNSLQEEALFPEGSTILESKEGNVLGFSLQEKGKTVFFLLEILQERREMFEKMVAPILHPNAAPHLETLSLFFCFCEELSLGKNLAKLQKESPHIQISLRSSFVLKHLSLCVKSPKKKGHTESLLTLRRRFTSLFPTHLFSTSSPLIEKALYRTLLSQKKTLAIAESCTGGNMSARLTNLPGASRVFVGSMVSYSSEMKEKCLGVSHKTLAKQGAVSKETVLEMLDGILAQTNACYALATSGIAGPTGGTFEKPVGTIWIGMASREGETHTHQMHLPEKMDRRAIISLVSTYLFASLWRYIEHQIPPFIEETP